jgi:O-antigen ligase
MRRLLLAIIMIEIPFQVDANLYYSDDVAAQGAIAGINISLTTICLALLYAMSLSSMVVRSPFGSSSMLRPSRPLVFYFAVLLLSVLVAANATLAFYEIFLLFQSFLLFLYIIHWVRTQEDVLFIVSMLLVGLLLQSVVMVAVGLVKHDIGFGNVIARIDRTRVEGTLGSPINAAAYLSLLLAPSLGLLVAPVARRYKCLAAAALGLGTMALVLTQSRGGWIACVVSCGIVCVLAWRRGWLSLAVPTAIAALIIMLVFVFHETLLARLFADDGGSASARLPLFQLAFHMIADHPLLGVGANNCAFVSEDYTNTVALRSAWFYTVHNKYLLVWVETGILGLSAFLWFLAATLRRGWLTWKINNRFLAPLGLAFSAAMMGQMIHMFVDVFHSRPQVQTFWLIAGVVTAIYNVSKDEASRNDDQP